MSVTIVSAVPSTSSALPANGIDATIAAEGGASGLDFANILLGQKLMNLTGKTGETGVKDDSQDGLASTDAGEVDAASILATLGLISQQTTDSPDQRAPGEVGKATAGSTTTLAPVAAGAGTDRSMKQEDVLQAASTVPAVAAGKDDTPAKLAVTTAVPESVPTAEPTAKSDEPSRTISTLANHPTATVQRDAPLAVHANVKDQAWSSEFSQKIVWLATADKQSAQLILNPPQMGPIEISLNVDKGSASASFVSANQEVRDAIETALPRLREMFASAGIQLGQTNVSSESFRQQSENHAASLGRSQAGGDNDILVGNSGESLTGRAFLGKAANGLVDLFA